MSAEIGPILDLHLTLDPARGRRAALEHALRDAIRTGTLAAGVTLPATRTLAGALDLARGTVRAAYDQLIAEGYLTARQGAGTTVAWLPQETAGPTRLADTATPRHDLRPGSPDVTTFPTAAWLRAARRALQHAPATAFGYTDPRGRPELRDALADYLGRARGVRTTPDRIVVTNGYVQALSLLTQVLDHPTIAMEDPGSALHREAARRSGATVVPLPVDEDGAVVDSIEAGIEADAVEVTPAHQYPTGVTLSPDRRAALTRWSGLVIENDYDGEFRYDRQPVGAVQGTAPERVAYVGTASKTLAPALRLGWLVLPRRLVDPVVDAKRHADHHTESLGQLTLAELVTSHAYDRHIRAARLRYRRRRDLLVQRLPQVRGIAAGLHVLLPLPDRTEDEVLAHADGLAVGRLTDRWHEPGDHPQGLVIGYGTPAEHAYPAALAALASALRKSDR